MNCVPLILHLLCKYCFWDGLAVVDNISSTKCFFSSNHVIHELLRVLQNWDDFTVVNEIFRLSTTNLFSAFISISSKIYGTKFSSMKNFVSSQGRCPTLAVSLICLYLICLPGSVFCSGREGSGAEVGFLHQGFDPVHGRDPFLDHYIYWFIDLLISLLFICLIID